MKSFAERLTEIKDKTIENITALGGDESGASSIILFFTDGSQISFNSVIKFHGNNEFPAESQIEIDN